MTKRKITLICIATLLASLISGCGKEVIVTPYPTPNSTTEQETTGENTQDNLIADEEHPAEIEYMETINGVDQLVMLQRYDLSFEEWKELETGIYVDLSAYDVSLNEGGYLIVPKDCGEVSTFLEIRCFKDVSEEDLAAGILDLYASDFVTKDLGKNYTENGVARLVTGQTADGTAWAAFIIPVEAGGCVTFVMRLPSATYAGHGERLISSVTTFFEK